MDNNKQNGVHVGGPRRVVGPHFPDCDADDNDNDDYAPTLYATDTTMRDRDANGERQQQQSVGEDNEDDIAMENITTTTDTRTQENRAKPKPKPQRSARADNMFCIIQCCKCLEPMNTSGLCTHCGHSTNLDNVVAFTKEGQQQADASNEGLYVCGTHLYT